MEKITSGLKEKMLSGSPGKASRLSVIVHLNEKADWHQGVRLLVEAGLQVESSLEEIRIVTGSIPSSAIRNIADIPVVGLIEADETASAMGMDKYQL